MVSCELVPDKMDSVWVGGAVLGAVLIVYELGAQQDRWCSWADE